MNKLKILLPMDCVVCCEPLEYYALYSCSHKICYKCATKLLFIYSDHKCPYCKIVTEKPIFKQVNSIELENSETIPLKPTIDNTNLSEIKNFELTNLNNTPTSLDNKDSISKKKSPVIMKDYNGDSLTRDFNKISLKSSQDENAFYESEKIKKMVKSLIENRCKDCKEVLKLKKDLIHHYKIKHAKLLCSVCVNNGHQFWYEKFHILLSL